MRRSSNDVDRVREFAGPQLRKRGISWGIINAACEAAVEERPDESVYEQVRTAIEIGASFRSKSNAAFQRLFGDAIIEEGDETELNVESARCCPVCGGEKDRDRITCSIQCSAKHRTRLNWDEIDLNDLLNVQQMTLADIGRKLGVTPKSVHRHLITQGVREGKATNG